MPDPEFIPYNGYLIQPAPMELDEGGWNSDLHIWTANYDASRKYIASDVWPTKEEAIKHIVARAQQIIDGKVPGNFPP